MREQFVSYEIALKLKKLGFNEKCLMGYDKNEMLFYSEQPKGHFLNYSIGMNINAPLWQQAIKFINNLPEYEKKFDNYIISDFKNLKQLENNILASLELITPKL